MSKKLLLLTTERENWAPKELVKKAEEAGYDVEVIDPEECYINLTNEEYISYKGTKYKGADLCIPRLSETNLDYKISIINHLDKMGVKVLNKGPALRTASNKIDTQIKLNAEGIKTPKTTLFTNDEQIDHAVEAIGNKFPVIVKTIYGTQGIGVIRADSRASLVSIVQQLIKSGTEFMLQEFIEHKESGRILFLGGKPLATVMRTVPEGSFRSNAHQGAELKVHKPSEQELEVCKKAADAIGIDFAAVDYIMDGDDVVILEVNGSPGFESMQKVVDIDVAKTVIDYCSSLIDGGKEEDKEETSTDNSKEEDDDKQSDKSEDDKQPELGELEFTTSAEKESGPTEEEEEEEETGTKEVDMDREEAAELDKKEEKSDEKSMNPHANIINPELLDNAHEQIIGTVTNVVIKHFNDEVPIEARVDTGANVSSIAGEDIKIDKDTNQVSFKFNGTVYKFHLLRIAKIRQADSDKTNERAVIRVDMTVNETVLHNIELNVNERSHMKYAILLGRNTLAQAALLINPAMNNISAISATVSTKEEE
jgi:ribosomal protein S6--L-glutamate ligase